MNDAFACSKPRLCTISSKTLVILPSLFQSRDSVMQISKRDIRGIALNVSCLFKGILCELCFFKFYKWKVNWICKTTDHYMLMMITVNIYGMFSIDNAALQIRVNIDIWLFLISIYLVLTTIIWKGIIIVPHFAEEEPEVERRKWLGQGYAAGN